MVFTFENHFQLVHILFFSTEYFLGFNIQEIKAQVLANKKDVKQVFWNVEPKVPSSGFHNLCM